MSEDDPPDPVDTYGASKWMAEQVLKHLSKEGLEYNALRYFNVYGERQAAHAFYTTVINTFVKRLLQGEPPVIDGAGTQSMDFTHVSDVARANILAIESEAVNEAFNVGTGVPTTVSDLALILRNAVGAEVAPVFNNGMTSLVSRRQADVRKARDLLGFEAQVKACQGLTEVAQAIAAHPDLY